ncbi:MAG: fimbrillin family protein [Paramuribaculum sp.]|nr:fimbrillin family protein [Paramuribaculum sp.]
MRRKKFAISEKYEELCIPVIINKFFFVMKFSSVIWSAAFVTVAACSDADTASVSPTIRILPKIQTRATDTAFRKNDDIGMTVRKEADGELYLENSCFTYNGVTFSHWAVFWYDDMDVTSTLIAYYPYSKAGQPGLFTIQTDQRDNGQTNSDLLAATKTGVKPGAPAVYMYFYHLLSKIDITTQVPENITLDTITIGGFVPTVEADIENKSVALAPGVAAVDVIAHEITANAAYSVVLPPQKTDMQVTVQSATGSFTKAIPNVTLLPGRCYTLTLTVTTEGQIGDLTLCARIEDWGNGGSIEQGTDGDQTIIELPEKPDNGDSGAGVEFGGVTYATTVVAGREWMAENLRYLSEEEDWRRFTHYWYPDNSASKAETLGVLYRYIVATGGTLPALNDAEKVQGICPAGWRLPTIGELQTLVEAAGKGFFTQSGFYHVSNVNGYNTTRSCIISSTVPDELRAYYLLIPRSDTQQPSTQAVPIENIAASIRCIKDPR